MKQTLARILCFALILAMLPGMLMLSASPVNAAYENTYKNTGDQRMDLIGVALTQVGYTEGSGNYTKYGVWYGSSNMAWCGAFVSWCANQAGIPTSVLRKNGFANLSRYGITDIFTYSSSRAPRPGDLFVKSNGTHVGIVYYVEGNYFYTIEGNTNAAGSSEGTCVRIQKRSLTGAYKFGSPRYTTDGGHNYKSYYESAHPHRQYMYCDHCNDYYYTGATSTSSSCTTCIQASCSHNYGNWVKTDNSKHARTCAKCGKTESKSHSWSSGKVTKKATCAEAGTKIQTCSACDAERTVTIDKLTTHSYGAWQYMDEKNHYHKCTVCGKEEKNSHTKADQWETDLFYHWYTCKDCDGKAGLGEHIFGEGCEEPCDTCEYLRPTGHIYAKEISWDESGHWFACENCSEKGSYTKHIFDSECDETCAECSFVRVTEHTFSEELTSDETGHYHICEVCGTADTVIPHIPGAAATEQSAQYCTECGYEIAPKLEHVHNFEPLSYDDTSHWGQCRCGEPYPAEAHVWDVNTGLCVLCQMELSTGVQQQVSLWETVWNSFHWTWLLPVIGVLAAVCVVLLITIKKRAKKKKKEPVSV